MPMIEIDGGRINIAIDGPENAPALMLSNSLGTTIDMWRPQMPALMARYRVIRYDRRGHGQSDIGRTPYSMEGFGRDVLAILDHLNIEKTHWCGLSMGGMVGQWLGANAPHRFNRMILSNTSSYYLDPTNWDNRIKALSEGSFDAIADGVMTAWFTASFRESEPQTVAAMKAMLKTTPVEGLYRMLQGAPHARSARPAADDQKSRSGHRRPARSGNALGGGRIHP